MEQLFEYLDYRHFLKARFEEMRRDRPWFSNRLISQKVQVDPGQLVKILQGQRHISERLIPNFSDFLKLDHKQREYFACLVRFNKAKTGEETKLYYEKITALREMSLPQVKVDQDSFYQKWFYSVVRVLFAFYHFDGDYKKLASFLSPPISEQEAREAVELLLKLGFIEKDGESEELRLTNRFITGGGNWRMMAVRHFQQQTIQLSERSLLNDPPEDRDISSLTVTLHRDEMEEFREMIAEFRKTTLRRVMETDREPDSVYQLNIQFIPVARVSEEDQSQKRQRASTKEQV